MFFSIDFYGFRPRFWDAKAAHFCDHPRSFFDTFAKKRPRASQEAPRRCQDPIKSLQDQPLLAFLGSGWAPKSNFWVPKSILGLPKPNCLPKAAFYSLQIGILINSGQIFVDFPPIFIINNVFPQWTQTTCLVFFLQCRKRIGVPLQGREGVNPFPGTGIRGYC